MRNVEGEGRYRTREKEEMKVKGGDASRIIYDRRLSLQIYIVLGHKNYFTEFDCRTTTNSVD